jgi:antitoxin component YwqK of YwqJK toxin-antitoxin module
MKHLLLLVSFSISLLAVAQTDTCKFSALYSDDNTTRIEGCMKNGYAEGLWKEYYLETKQLRFIWTFSKGLKTGPYKALYDNGSIEAAGTYKNGTLDDSLKMYDRNGKLLEIQIWKAAPGEKSSDLIKTISLSNTRPDGTVEMDGTKMYIWRDGKKEFVEDIGFPIEEPKKEKKNKKK